MNMKTIKMHYSASEMDPWAVEMRVVDFNINTGIIYCELNDTRVTLHRDERGYVIIPMDADFYESKNDNKYYVEGHAFEMLMYVFYDEVLDWMNTTIL